MEENKKKRVVKNNKNKILMRTIKDTIIREYEDPNSPTFGKSSQIVRKVLLRKCPAFRKDLTEKVARDTLKKFSSTYSLTRKLKKSKCFHGTSFYSTHPHYRWHVDLQDMTIVRKVACLKRKDTFNFLLVCVDDFSNYIMVEAIQNKQAKTVFQAFAKIVKREKLFR